MAEHSPCLKKANSISNPHTNMTQARICMIRGMCEMGCCLHERVGFFIVYSKYIS